MGLQTCWWRSSAAPTVPAQGWRHHPTSGQRLCNASRCYVDKHGGQLPPASQLQRRPIEPYNRGTREEMAQRRCLQCGSASPGGGKQSHWRRHPATSEGWLCVPCYCRIYDQLKGGRSHKGQQQKKQRQQQQQQAAAAPVQAGFMIASSAAPVQSAAERRRRQHQPRRPPVGSSEQNLGAVRSADAAGCNQLSQAAAAVPAPTAPQPSSHVSEERLASASTAVVMQRCSHCGSCHTEGDWRRQPASGQRLCHACRSYADNHSGQLPPESVLQRRSAQPRRLGTKEERAQRRCLRCGSGSLGSAKRPQWRRHPAIGEEWLCHTCHMRACRQLKKQTARQQVQGAAAAEEAAQPQPQPRPSQPEAQQEPPLEPQPPLPQEQSQPNQQQQGQPSQQQQVSWSQPLEPQPRRQEETDEQKCCIHCGSSRSSGHWRRHLTTGQRLCNACGKYAGMHGGQLPSNSTLQRRLAQPQWRAVEGEMSQQCWLQCVPASAGNSMQQQPKPPLPPPQEQQQELRPQPQQPLPQEQPNQQHGRSPSLPQLLQLPPAQQQEAEQKCCSHCGSNHSSGHWRRHAISGQRLCNACGDYSHRHGGQLPSNSMLQRRSQLATDAMAQRCCLQCGAAASGSSKRVSWSRHPATGAEWLCQPCYRRAAWQLKKQQQPGGSRGAASSEQTLPAPAARAPQHSLKRKRQQEPFGPGSEAVDAPAGASPSAAKKRAVSQLQQGPAEPQPAGKRQRKQAQPQRHVAPGTAAQLWCQQLLPAGQPPLPTLLGEVAVKLSCSEGQLQPACMAH